ncbi:MAG: GNAT family N-acetyltransferase [Bacteroidetes bacterium]|nr:GNAT family N-acetyltransferase [Bacteroidota bacterium]
MSIEYRELNPSESKKYRVIRLECLQNASENFGATYEEQVNIPELYFEAAIRNGDANNKIFGAFEGENLIAICGYKRETGVKTRHKALLVQVYTKPEYRGKNISYELMNFMIEKIFEDETVQQITLGVVSDNISAVKTYERLGFTEYGFHKNYFKDGDEYKHQLLMMLERK